MNFFIDLIETGKIRTKEELRSLYRQFIKTYHPDSSPARAPGGARDKAVDFDELKRDYRRAAERLEELAATRGSAAPGQYLYDAGAFVDELRDLVARGLPANPKAVRRNKAYAASIDYVSRSIEQLYSKAYSFAELDEQLKFLSRRIPRVYYYTLQVFWSCFDCASGYGYAKTIAVRHLGCISFLLKEMGYASLDKFLFGLIEIAERVGRAPAGKSEEKRKT